MLSRLDLGRRALRRWAPSLRRATSEKCATSEKIGDKILAHRNARRNAVTFLAAAAAFAVSGAVSADTLAQPRDTALERKAADYVRYREDVLAIEQTPFDSAKKTREAHKLLSAHAPEKLSSGWVAYAALVAADTPEFAEAMKKEMKKSTKVGGRRLKGRDGLVANLAADPSYPRKMKGADAAIARVLAMSAMDAARYNALGESFKTQAYAMQKTKWGKARIAASSKRINEADGFRKGRGAPATPAFSRSTNGGVTAPQLASIDAAWSPDWSAETSAGVRQEPHAQVIIDRVMNLAARYAVGGLNAKTVNVYARNDRAQKCLYMAELTLKQCIAATRTSYEEAFCLGEHGLNDIGSCIGWVAGAS